MTTEKAANVSRRNGHDWCLLCGARNPWSLNLSFRADGEGAVNTEFSPHPRLQGYQGVLHGGVISALLDSAMTHCLFHRGVRAVTGDLRVRFLRPASCRGPLRLTARVLSSTPRLYRLRAELSDDKGILAWGEAKFLRRRE
ncbi:MAG: PaaI family thioesterase [Candidatus Eisenbacteria bacterium]